MSFTEVKFKRLSRWLLSLTLLVGVSHSVKADHQYDSLKSELTKSHTPLERNSIYRKLLDLQYKSGTKNKDNFIQDALDNLAQIKNPNYKVTVPLYRNIAVCLYGMNRASESLTYFDKAIAVVKDKNDPILLAKVLYNKSSSLIQLARFEESIANSQRALAVLRDYPKSPRIIDLKILIANCHRDLGNSEASIKELRSAMALVDEGNPESKQSLMNSTGRIFMDLGQYDSATYYYKLAIQVGETISDKRFLGSAYNNLGNALETSGDLKGALVQYVKSLEIKEEIGDAKSIAIAYLNVGSIRYSLGKHLLAEQNIRKSLSYATAANSEVMTSYGYLKLGNVFAKLEVLDSAIFYHKKSLDKSTAVKFSKGMIESELSLASDYRLLGDLSESYQHYKKALTSAKEHKSVSSISSAQVGIAKLYLENSKFSPSERVLDFDKHEIENQLISASENSLKINNMNGIVTSLNALRMFYANEQDAKKEAYYAGKYIAYKDSLYTQDNAQAIAEWETKYETAEKEKEIKLLEKDAIIVEAKAKRRQLLTISFGILAIILGAIGIILYNQLKLRQKLKMERFRNKIATDLHDDVGSTLSSISMYSEVILQKTKDSVPEIQPMLKNMSSNSREIVEAMGDIVWTINPKNNTLNSLIARVRSKTADLCDAKGVKFSFSKGNNNEINIDMESAQNIYLVLKESINNALKYSECTTLVLTTALDGKNFVFEVKDNGKGFDVSSATSGNGMRTMRERMKEIGGQLTVVSSNEGTIVSGILKV